MNKSRGLCDYCKIAEDERCSAYKKDVESGRYILVKQCGRYYPNDSYLDMIQSFKEKSFDGKIYNKEVFN